MFTIYLLCLPANGVVDDVMIRQLRGLTDGSQEVELMTQGLRRQINA